jgi:hypothetical protein
MSAQAAEKTCQEDDAGPGNGVFASFCFCFNVRLADCVGRCVRAHSYPFKSHLIQSNMHRFKPSVKLCEVANLISSRPINRIVEPRE